jgi:hypothetical protein
LVVGDVRARVDWLPVGGEHRSHWAR